MRSLLFALVAIAVPVAAANAAATEFWNLTSSTITSLTLAPAGTAAFGPNQCANDKDAAVDHDERLNLVGVPPGRYDVRVVDKKGRSCIARNVEVVAARVAFSLTDEDLEDCR